ncbi:EcsC family protein [Acinetobacter bouvetii]|uniref:EcsC protein family protein n=1 Tax=Acinetobacter bouvetii TaxID=202951 RepID=A0A811GAM5_9GAMM|nr:EcsC family protein [Acinetobacter bouvetii]CAB1209813.1 EcsC protein family protein [Acinetobacter bouvetii]
MANSNNKHTGGFFSNALGVAKKISATGINVLSHTAPDGVSKLAQPFHNGHVIEGSARAPGMFESKRYDNPQQMMREYLPNVSKQLLGRQYGKVSRVASFVSPQLSDKVSDYFFDHLNQFTSNLSSVDAVLDQAGAKDLQELTQDVDRSKRLSQALAEQNKWMASVQGAVTGASGVLGSAIDVPLSLVMSLRMIYQVGRAYGFELNKDTEQDIVQFVFKQIDLGQIAEKQSVLMALKALSNMLQTHDISQFQQILGSANDTAALKKWLVNENGEMKWDWLNHLPKISLISKLTPVAGAGIGAVYSWRLVEDVNQKAQQIFSTARSYLHQHHGSELSPIAAYEKSLELLAQAAPRLLDHLATTDLNPAELILGQDIDVEDHQTISKVMLKKKTDTVQADDDKKEARLEQGLGYLAEHMVAPHAQVEPQKPAITAEQPDEYAEEEVSLNEPVTDQVVANQAEQAQQNEAPKPAKRKVTKKTT